VEDVARRRLWWFLAILWASGIVVASSIPGHRLPDAGFDGVDKAVHFLEFAMLAHFLARAWRFAPAVLLCVAFGVLDELHQTLTPNREPSVYDALADALGALAGAALVLWWQDWQRRRRSHGDRS
jgi:hypothetical protein